MAQMTYRQAIASGIAQEMERDHADVMIGEDVGAAGGVFKSTEGLLDRFGPERGRGTPLSEQAIVGAAMGAAMTGLRPIAELMFSDFFAVAWDMVVNQIAKTRYMTGGQVTMPLVLRTANGAGLRFGAQHSQSVENWAMAIPGLKVVAPSTPADMHGLMAAAERLQADHGISAEVIDLRCLVPLDVATILASVEKTSRMFTVEENPRLCGWGAEIASIVVDEGFWSLDAPIVRITTPHVPLPSAAVLEDAAIPSVERIVETVSRRLEEAR